MNHAIAKRTAEPTHTVEQTRGAGWEIPAVDITENFEEITVTASMPGVLHEDIEVTFENGELRILGRVRAPDPAPVEYLLREFAPAGYQRTFQVGTEIDSNGIEAEYENGVLTLHLPKAESAKPRSIPVKSR